MSSFRLATGATKKPLPQLCAVGAISLSAVVGSAPFPSSCDGELMSFRILRQWGKSELDYNYRVVRAVRFRTGHEPHVPVNILRRSLNHWTELVWRKNRQDGI